MYMFKMAKPALLFRGTTTFALLYPAFSENRTLNIPTYERSKENWSVILLNSRAIIIKF